MNNDVPFFGDFSLVSMENKSMRGLNAKHMDRTFVVSGFKPSVQLSYARSICAVWNA